MSLVSKIQSLLTAANAKTGVSDTTLTAAVSRLIAGYGGGGGGGTAQLETIELLISGNSAATLITAFSDVIPPGLICAIFVNTKKFEDLQTNEISFVVAGYNTDYGQYHWCYGRKSGTAENLMITIYNAQSNTYPTIFESGDTFYVIPLVDYRNSTPPLLGSPGGGAEEENEE